MKLNKKKFMETELGHEIKDCIENLDSVLCVSSDAEYGDTVKIYLVQWEAFKLAIKQFYGVEYHFTRTDDYYGVCTENERNWLFKIERRL